MDDKRPIGEKIAENWINGNCTDAINAGMRSGAHAAAALLYLLEYYGQEKCERFGAALIRRRRSQAGNRGMFAEERNSVFRERRPR
jgi:hypothetical protein